MSTSIIEHRNRVITRPDGQLDDREMKVFDHKAGVHHKPKWSSLDRSFSRIERSLRQKAGTRHWLLRNSWGKRWGENGHIKVTDDYVRQFRDVWVGTRMDELV